jgi:hypothetical protein
MALEELRSGEESARPQLVAARQRFIQMRQTADAELELLFRESDHAASPEIYNRIRQVLVRRRYIQNLIQETEKELAP